MGKHRNNQLPKNDFIPQFEIHIIHQGTLFLCQQEIGNNRKGATNKIRL